MHNNNYNKSLESHKVPFILKENRKKALAILAYDIFMFIQLIIFYALCLTLGVLSLLLDKITFKKIFFNGFINTFALIANIGKAP